MHQKAIGVSRWNVSPRGTSSEVNVKLHGFTAVASSRSSAEPAEAYPPSHEATADYPHHIHPPRHGGVAFCGGG